MLRALRRGELLAGMRQVGALSTLYWVAIGCRAEEFTLPHTAVTDGVTATRRREPLLLYGRWSARADRSAAFIQSVEVMRCSLGPRTLG